MIDKKQKRLRRAQKIRYNIKRQGVTRLAVHRTPRHIYAQLLAPDGKVLAAASTLSPEVKTKIGYSGNVDAAKCVGQVIAEQATTLDIKQIAFDRSGFKYHGRIKALAEAARAGGMNF